MDDTLPPADVDVEIFPCTTFQVHRPSKVVHLERPVPWVWDGYLARGSITLLTGWWKIGKSTLLAALLGRLGAGGDLGGRAVAPGKALVVSEEGLGPWQQRFGRHGIGDWASFLCDAYTTRDPLPREWGLLLQGVASFRKTYGLDVVVLDTLSGMLPGGAETNARAMASALRPVRELAAAGVAVLLVHHPRKGAVGGGQAARGTGVLPAAVDIILEYLWAGPATKENRRRRLLGWSRHLTTPREVVLELDAAGTGYTVVPTELADLDDTTRTVLDLVRATPGLTAREVHLNWPAASNRPGPRRVQEVLHRLAAAGDVSRTRRPHTADPFRYYEAAPSADPATPPAGQLLDPFSTSSPVVLDLFSTPSPPVLDPSPRRSLHGLTAEERRGPAGFRAGALLTARDLAERYRVSERSAAKLCARWLLTGAVTVEDGSTKGRQYRVAGAR